MLTNSKTLRWCLASAKPVLHHIRARAARGLCPKARKLVIPQKDCPARRFGFCDQRINRLLGDLAFHHTPPKSDHPVSTVQEIMGQARKGADE